MSLQERRFYQILSAMTPSEAVAFKRRADSCEDCNEEALALVTFLAV